MRIIGHLGNEPAARTFGDYLYVQGIKNQVEPEGDGRWAIWIHGEDELDNASRLFRKYLTNPDDAEFQTTAAKATAMRARDEEDQAAAQRRQFDRDRLFSERNFLAAAPLTVALIVISVVVYLVREYTSLRWITDYLFISDPDAFARDLPEVRQGQVWRLVTPIFLHSSMPLHLHILFNMLWLKDLGAMIESRIGRTTLGLLVVVIAIGSNLAQNILVGPNFLGMSGVVYGLLGYVWMRGRFDPSSGLYLHQSTVMMMLLWLAFGFTGMLRMANVVHTVGLVVGMVWGFATARLR